MKISKMKALGEDNREVLRVVISDVGDHMGQIFDLMTNKMRSGGFYPYKIAGVGRSIKNLEIHVDFDELNKPEDYQIAIVGRVEKILKEENLL